MRSEKDYDNLVAMKQQLYERHGYRLYKMGEVCWMRGITALYWFKWKPHVSVCLRLYDEWNWLYTDIYCKREMPAEQLVSYLNGTDFRPGTRWRASFIVAHVIAQSRGRRQSAATRCMWWTTAGTPGTALRSATTIRWQRLSWAA